MSYHVLGGRLVEVADNGKLSLVMDAVGAYMPVNHKYETGLSYSYVRGNKNVIARDNRACRMVPVVRIAAKIIVATKRCNSADLREGWRICGGIPCYVDRSGRVVRLYHNGVYVSVYDLEGRHPSFAAWKFAIGSQSAEILVNAALNATVWDIYVRPCCFRERATYGTIMRL